MIEYVVFGYSRIISSSRNRLFDNIIIWCSLKSNYNILKGTNQTNEKSATARWQYLSKLFIDGSALNEVYIYFKRKNAEPMRFSQFMLHSECVLIDFVVKWEGMSIYSCWKVIYYDNIFQLFNIFVFISNGTWTCISFFILPFTFRISLIISIFVYIWLYNLIQG